MPLTAPWFWLSHPGKFSPSSSLACSHQGIYFFGLKISCLRSIPYLPETHSREKVFI